ncbi:hypothetical protein LTR37_015056 [Vermiconidia calcicola]|uniref:Uncharacterized protein n=1 Tax=Vermiconidia calcicola TaxID=1690605 RepID=A0ACC3MRX4_9PEZI|nr:hypothetical protein LTR37_015056 [Vermiconidia calcicola]
MSEHDRSSPIQDAASGSERGSNPQDIHEATQRATAAYQAPYHSHEEGRVPGVYIVAFHPGHTIAKHFAFLGREFDLTSLDERYFANMDDELFHAARRDPGVKFVEDDVTGERDGAYAQHAQPTDHQAEYHHYPHARVPGVYIIAFYPGHTVAKHFLFLGCEFDLTTLDQGYSANLDDDLFSAVRRDPGVEYIEDNCRGLRVGAGEV